jgi:hypothetical protein
MIAEMESLPKHSAWHIHESVNHSMNCSSENLRTGINPPEICCHVFARTVMCVRRHYINKK